MAPQRPPTAPPLASYRPVNERGSFPPRQGPLPPRPGNPRPRPPAPRRGFGFLRGLAYLLLFAGVVAGAGLGYLAINPPSDLIRQRLATEIKAKTGRDLVIAGGSEFTFLPALGVSLKNVSLSPPPGMAGEPFVSIAALDVAIKVAPLLRGEVGIKKLVLKNPVFVLRVDKDGNKSWDFAAAGAPAHFAQADPERGTATDAPPVEAPASQGRSLPAKLQNIKDLQLDDVRIENGTLRYSDERSGKTHDVGPVNVKVAAKSLTSPVSADGDLVWQGEKIDFDGTLANVKTVLEEKPAKLAFNATSKHISAHYDGSVLIKDGADLDGQVNAQSGSAKKLATWLGTNLPPVTGFGPVALAGDIRTTGSTTNLTNVKIDLDGATATGVASVTTGGVRPYVQANLKISALDLNKYTTGAGAAASAPAPIQEEPPPPAPAAGAPAKAGDAIEQLLNEKAGPKVHGYTQRAGWSSEQINLTLLGIADVDAKVQLGKLFFQDITVGQSALTVALKNKVMRTTFEDVQLYEGHGKGFLNIDGTGKAAIVGANFALEGVSAQPFLKDAADMNWLAGTAKIGLQLATQGSNQLQMVESLNGKSDFALSNGAIVGFNLPGAIRGLSQGKLSGFKKAPSEKTDFSELAGSFQITNGVAQNQDLRLTSPLLRVTGAGSVQMPQRTLDYTVKPKLVASLEGQQGATNLAGLEVPVRITGSWDKPSYEPDLKGIDPNKAVEAVKEIGKQFKGKNANEIVDGLLGKKNSDGTTGSTSTSTKAKDLLNKLLKPQ